MATTTLTEDQRDAIERIEARLAVSREAVLVGPAGSGKTTVLRVLLDRLEASGREVVLAAPTGKAAVRLAQATGREATTLHRRIYRRRAHGWERTEHVPAKALPCDADVRRGG